MKRIYMDFAATAPVKKEVFEAMKPYFGKIFGNPSSIHSFGQSARAAVEKSRTQVAKFLNCEPSEVIFTSGGTESDNLAIRGIVHEYHNFYKHRSSIVPVPRQASESRLDVGTKQLRSTCSLSPLVHAAQAPQVAFRNYDIPHIVTTEFEHHAVLHTCKDLEKQGLAEVTYIKPNKEGLISVEQVKKAIKKNTILVSIMYVNNEIGTVQPIRELSAISSQLSAKNSKLNPYSLPLTPYFHTDAVQATEYFTCDTKKLNVDLMSLSGHKIGGPKGVGILFVKKSVKISPIQTGGAQEFNMRAGTENVAGIVGTAKAIELINPNVEIRNPKQIQNPNKKNSKTVSKFDIRVSNLTKLRDYFIDQIEKNIPDIILNGSREKRSPNNINFSFKYIEGEAILLNLDLVGIAASSGSACTSGSLEPSHVLLSIGRKHEDAHGSIRFTISENTTKQEVDYVVKNLKQIVEKLRLMSPFGK